MNWKGWTLLGTILLIGGGVAAFMYLSPKSVPEPIVETPEVGNLEGQNLYASGDYGFMLMYPETARLEEAFSADYHLGSMWRANASAASTGTPVFAIVAYETTSDNSYPRYYRALVRLGVADGASEVASCEKVTPDAGETELPDVVIHGTTWKAFSFADAGMMQYVKGVSYRTVHDGTCYALEKIAAGSSYKEDASEQDIAPAVLEAEYAKLDAIVTSFTFVP